MTIKIRKLKYWMYLVYLHGWIWARHRMGPRLFPGPPAGQQLSERMANRSMVWSSEPCLMKESQIAMKSRLVWDAVRASLEEKPASEQGLRKHIIKSKRRARLLTSSSRIWPGESSWPPYPHILHNQQDVDSIPSLVWPSPPHCSQVLSQPGSMLSATICKSPLQPHRPPRLLTASSKV